MTDNQSPDPVPRAPITTLDDIVRVLGADGTFGFTYRSFEVVDLGNRQCSVRLGSWNPLTKLFTPHGQLLLSEEAARLLVKQLQAHVDGLAQRDDEPWYERVVKALSNAHYRGKAR